jgi:ornithine cyclodeaminase
MSNAAGFGKTILLLRPQDIRGLITVEESIDLIERGYREAQDFPLVNAPRRRVHTPEGVRVSNFPGGIPGLGVIGSLTRAESVTHESGNQTYPFREHPVYNLWDSKTSEFLAIIIGELFDERSGFPSVMALRTGATSGVGFRHMARKDAKTVGLYGTGGQAMYKMLALKAVRPITHVKVYSRNPENRRAFCERMSPMIETPMSPVSSPREVMRGVDIVVCATNSNVPVFDGRWIEPGQHITTVVGSNIALVKGGWIGTGRRENDDETVRRADFIITNSRESVIQDQQAGLWDPLEAGIITWEKIHELGEILNGSFPGRTNDEQVTYHANNNGTAAADLALAMHVYRKAKQEGRGVTIDLPVPGSDLRGL